MKEVFEKIIEKLEELKSRNPFIHGKTDKCRDASVSRQTLEYAIQIVKQEAAEQNNGWIPCSERLPENISTVILQVKEIEKPTFGWYGNKRWRLTEKEFVELNNFTVVAWMPLPEPYQKKEQDSCINCPCNSEAGCTMPSADISYACPRKSNNPTNADHIRSMSDDELARLITSGELCAICPFCKYYETKDCYMENDLEHKNCDNGIMEWLQSEVEE